MTTDDVKESLFKEEDIEPTCVNYLGYKMWTIPGINNNVDELLRFVNEYDGHFECYAMRKVQTNEVGVAVIISNGIFNTDANIFALIKYTKRFGFNLWIHEQSFYKKDDRFDDKIPRDVLQIPFIETNLQERERVYNKAIVLPYEITKGCVGVCCGANFVEDYWIEDMAVWIFSLFDDLVPVSIIQELNVSKVLVIKASPCNFQNFDIASPGQFLQSGLKLYT